ncbi:MAG: TolC family protein [Candidatus Glassbacteria bacterium]|nr:TolC family protein [Candidatus Glassbacteria bacterium]
MTRPRHCSAAGIRAAVAAFILLAAGPPTAGAQMKMTLDLALEIAMQNSPEIRSTRLDLVRSRELLRAQQAALKSHFSLSLAPFSYSHDQTFNSFLSAWSTSETKSSSSTFTASQPIIQTDGTLLLINRFSWQDSYSSYNAVRNKAYTNDIYLRLTQPLFTYNRTRMETLELELDLEQTQLRYAIQKLSLEKQLTQSFFNVYQNRMSLDIGLEELKNQQKSYEITRSKQEAGLVALEELYQAELNLGTSKSTVQNRRVTLENSLDSFKQLLGMELTDSITVEADVEYKPVEVDLEKALAEGLKNRMELRQRSIGIETARNDLVRTQAQNEFKGDVTLSYGITGKDEQFTDMYDKPTKTQTFEVSFDIPLWDWGEKKSRIKASEATIEQRELTLEDEKIAINLGVRQVHRNLINSAEQIELARQNVRNAELTYEINLERYINGDLTSMDLNLYQEQLSQRKTGLVNALIDYKLALLDMKIQSLWDFEHKKPALYEE